MFDHRKVIDNADGAIIVILTLMKSEIFITRSILLRVGRLHQVREVFIRLVIPILLIYLVFFSCNSKEYQYFY